MFKKINFLLITALILGGLLRFIWLSSYPSGFTPDEAALGYNAYSLLQTGRDEWGTPWWQLPFTNLRSFGDYKPPLYTFLALPFVGLFGLNEFSVRAVSATFGTLAILSIYLLANKLFPGLQVKVSRRHSLNLGQISALIFAISPWSISLSRIALEANLVTLMLPLAIYLFLSEKYRLAAIIFAINLYSYHSARVITPLVFLSLTLIKKPVINSKFIKSILLFVALAIPALVSYLGVGSARLSDVGIFNPTDNWAAVSDRRFAANIRGLPDSVSRIFSNKIVYTASLFTGSLISYFSPEFYFIRGAGETTYGMIRDRGVLYIIELPLLLIFLVRLARKFDRKYIFLVLMIFAGALPAAMSKAVGFSANRVAPMLPFLLIILSLGLYYLLQNISKYRFYFSITILAAYVLCLSFFIEDYLYHAPSQSAPAMSFGWKEIISRASPMFDRYSEVRFSRTLSEPHIFVAFYLKIDPKVYHQAADDWSDFEARGFTFLDQYDGYRLGNFRFGDLKAAEPVSGPTLYVGKPSDFPIGFTEYFHVDYPDGKTAIRVSEKLP